MRPVPELRQVRDHARVRSAASGAGRREQELAEDAAAQVGSANGSGMPARHGASSNCWLNWASHSRRSRTLQSVEFDELCGVSYPEDGRFILFH